MAYKPKNGDTPVEIVAGTDTVAETVTTASKNVETAVQTSVASAAAGFEKTQTEIKSKMEQAMKTAEEMTQFSQGTIEAFLKSGQIWAAGVTDLSKALATTAQAQMEATMATFKALAAVKSLKEAVELQTSMARSSMETAMAESGKLTDASMKLAEQAIAPIAARMSLAAEKFGRVN